MASWFRIVLSVGYVIGVFPWTCSLNECKSYWERMPSLIVIAGGLAAYICSLLFDDVWKSIFNDNMVDALNGILLVTSTMSLLVSCFLAAVFGQGCLRFLPSSKSRRPLRDALVSVLPIAGYIWNMWALLQDTNLTVITVFYTALFCSSILVLTLLSSLSLLHYADSYDSISPETKYVVELFRIQRQVLSFKSNFQWQILGGSIFCVVHIFVAGYFLVARVRSQTLDLKQSMVYLSGAPQSLLFPIMLNVLGEHLKHKFQATLDRLLYDESPTEDGLQKQSSHRMLLERYEPKIDIWGFFTLGSDNLGATLVSVLTFLAILVQLLQGEKV